MTSPFSIFQNGDLCLEASVDGAHGALPSLIFLESLLSSVVRVSSRAGGRARTKEQASVHCLSPWNEEEKLRSLAALHPWIEGVSSSNLGTATTLYPPSATTVAGGCEDACSFPGRLGREESFSLDDAAVESVVRGSFWRACSGNGGRDTNELGRVAEESTLDTRRLHSRVHGLCRLLQQRREERAYTPKTPVAKSTGLREIQKRRNASEESERLDTRRMFDVMTGSAEGRSVQDFGHGGTEPFLVGLVCREPSGGSTRHALSVRPFVTTGLTALSGEVGDGLVRGDLGTEEHTEEPGESSFSVMLIEVEMDRLDSEELQISAVWQTLLSVVDFVYAAASASIIARVASSMNGVYCAAVAAPGFRHFGVGCGARPVMPPSFFYSLVGGEAPAMSMNLCSGKAHCVSDIHAVLAQLMLTQELRAVTCCRDPLQWSMLLTHTWLLTKGAQGVAAVFSLQKRMGNAITAAVDMFVATAEGVLLAMYAMEPLPPLSLRGDAIGTVTVFPRDLALEDVLHMAHQVALLAFDTDVVPCVFDGRLTPRHAALQDAYCGCRYHIARDALNRACKLASESLKERLCAFAAHAATQALQQSPVRIVSMLGSACSEDGSGAVSLVDVITEATQWIHHFLTAPLISHYGVQDGTDTNHAAVAAATGGGCGHRHSLPCRMVESPIIAAAAPNAKAVVLSEYLEQTLLPALLGAARERESVVHAQERRASETREALLVAEDNYLQLQQRLEQAKAQLEHQRGVLQEAKRHSSVLRTQLHACCMCLRKLVQTCVGYEETHGHFTRQTRFQLKHGVVMSDAAPVSDFPPEGPRQREAMMDMDALVTTPPKDAASVNAAIKSRELTMPLSAEDDRVNNDASAAVAVAVPLSTSSSSCEQVELLKRLLRDAHQQLRASHNVLLYLYEEAHETLHQMSADGGDVGLDDSRQFLLSASPRTARNTTPVRRLGRSVSDVASEAVSAEIFERTPRRFAAGMPETSHQELYLGESSQLAVVNTSAKSSPSPGLSGIHYALPNTDVGPTDQMPLPQKPQRDGGEEKAWHHYTPVSGWSTAVVSLLPTPDRGVTSAVEAIADLQRQRQEAAEALTRLEKQYEAVNRQLEERDAALMEAQSKHKAEEERWGAEREALLSRLRAAAGETYMAEKACKAHQQEVQHWAHSWAEMMDVAEAEANNALLANAGVHTLAVLDDVDVDDSDKTGEDGKHISGERDTTPIRVTTPEEALACGKRRLRGLMVRVESTARERASNVAERHTAVLQRELERAREQARKEELQKQADTTATLRAAEGLARTAEEAAHLREALAAATEREGLLRLDRDELAVQKEDVWRRLHCMEEAYVALLNMWEEAVVPRCAVLLWQWGDMVTAFREKNDALKEQLRQSKAEAQYLGEVLHVQADAAQQRVEEVERVTKQLDGHRIAQSTAEKRVAQLLRRLDQLAMAYVVSCNTWEQAMARRCELLLETWEYSLRFNISRPRCEWTSGEAPWLREAEPHDPCGLFHELQQKRRRIAELEEALRQNKVRCETLEEAVAQLNALLMAQRELGMAPPPSPPLVSHEYGVLPAADMGTTNAAPLVNAFYTLPNRLSDTGGGDMHPLWGVAAGSQSGAKRPSAVSLEDLLQLNSAGHVEDSMGPRPLNWYLQSLSAIESTLLR
ncbi:hypothetical protein TraAM80_03585 [Trypanosoma rangeli]|uniref:Uncharacterized protein n=1 Tax=Trypanosoma rangeli TaxID=5698 RepID=A0A3R7NIQ9_TRYRA|nr:uncharacterized protein TraAM80_03585 [Trypanosoma rangeli]RNF07098.1 hypothetical protein TraAM80_03585 [Trypanosoma rangeli]|eukprot:RNF07098.1 hypothetical protein TraAM80_03585 [Trypanosoma rangeli]